MEQLWCKITSFAVTISPAKTLQSSVSSQKSLQMQATIHMGNHIGLIVVASILKAAHLCKHLTGQDLIHGIEI